MARSLVLTHVNHSDVSEITNVGECEHSCVKVLKGCLAKYIGYFLNKGGTCNLVLCLPLRCYLSCFQFHFWKRHLVAKTIPTVIRKSRGWFMIFWQTQGRGEPFLPTCQSTRHPLFCFNFLWGVHWLAVTPLLWLYSWLWPNFFIILSKEGSVQQFLSAQRKMSLG